MVEIEIAVDAQAIIGESPLWSPGEGALYWIDVKAPALFRFQPDTGHQQRWPVPAECGGFALYPGLSAALVALRNGLFKLDLTTSALVQVAPAPFDPDMHRFNEGACDPSGRFWIGVMFDPLDPASPELPSALHSYTTQGGLRPERDQAELHNGMAWGRRGETMYLTHTKERTIYRFATDGTGKLSGKTRFATVPANEGLPDGAAMDEAGGYWCALHGVSRIRRFHPDGSHDRDIMLPVSQPTKCAFAGAALDIMYVTSATDGLSPEQRRQQPHAGALLRLRPGERGLPRRCTID